MRTRHSLTAAIIALIAILIGIIISLLVGRGPIANAEEPAPTPTSAEPTPPPKTETNTKTRTKTSPTRTGKASHPSKPSNGKTSRPPTTPPTTPAKPPIPPRPPAGPPRFGTAAMPSDADYVVSDDGQAFAMNFSSLESGTDIGRLSRTQKMTLPVTGDGKGKNLLLTVTGYVFTERDATAKLTVTINGGTSTVVYQPGHDVELMRSLDIPLRGVHQLKITVTVEVIPAKPGKDAYLNVAALDGLIE